MLGSKEIKANAILAFIINGVFMFFFVMTSYVFSESEPSLIDIGLYMLVALIGYLIIFTAFCFANKLVRFLNDQKLSRLGIRRWLISFLIIIAFTLLFTKFTTFVLPAVVDWGHPFFHIQPFLMMSFPNFLLGLVIFGVAEMWNAFEENRDLQLTLANVEKEKVASQLAALQQKINPHFLFNSLSVLSELTYDDPEKANEFIQEFAKVYRYVLDFKEETLVTVKKEMEFLEAYLFLQKIRFGESLRINNQLEQEVLDQYIPPLSLQLLFENAIKHNRGTKARPLFIHLKKVGEYLIIRNNLQARLNPPTSNGVGLSNLRKTYSLISSAVPKFQKIEGEFIVKLPLLKVES